MNDEQQGQTPGAHRATAEGSGPAGPEADKKVDKLDQWIEQNLHMDAHKANPAPAQEQKPKTEQTQKPAGTQDAHSAQPAAQTPPPAQTHAQQGQAAVRKPFVANPKAGAPGPATSGHRPATQGRSGTQGPATSGHRPNTQSHHPTNAHRPAPNGYKPATPGYNRPASTGYKPAATGQKPPHHAQSPQPKKKFFGIFGGRNDNRNNNNRQATTAAPIKHFAAASALVPSQGNYHGKLRLIMIGGLDEVGKNCMILEYGDDIMIIDMGFQFPEEDMLGVDYVIPDLSYLDDKIDRIRAIVITHGHLDHVGAIPYVMAKLKFPPIYATKLTNGLIQKRLEEFGLLQQTKLIDVTKDDVIQLGQFNVSFFHVNHSIPDAVGIVVKTPAGNIVHTGDFKFDFTPSGDQAPPDFARLAAIGNQDIAALFIDSTNALKPGYTISERKVGASLENIVKNTDGRILIASFSSQIGRIQQIIDYAKRHGRTIFLSGRSLNDNVFIASKLGYLKIPQGIVQDVHKMGKIPENKVIILTTGSQGEAVSALSRMALEEHPKVKIKKGDTVVLSSSPIPGNEKAISLVTNNLCKLGAKIINNQIMDVHTSGHAQQEDLKLMMHLVKAKTIVPIHGEYYMRFGNKEIAMAMGYNEKNVALVENGAVLEIENGQLKIANEGVENKYILIDGLGVGDIGAQVMMDRQTLAENGVLILVISVDEKTHKMNKDVDVISRGFIYMKESEVLVKAISELARDAYNRVLDKRGAETKRGDIKKYIKESVDKFVHQKIERHPLVLPIIIEQ